MARKRAVAAANFELPLAAGDASGPDLRTRAAAVRERLCAVYFCPIPYFHDLDPVSELVSSLLSHRTKNADSAAAFRALRERFATWEAVRDAGEEEVREAIARATWPELKAPRVRAVLRRITELRGALDLDFLEGMPVPDARAWLEALPGVGPKTSAAVLLFSRMRRPALPVDSHHQRVAERLGLIPAGVSSERAHRLLEALLPEGASAQEVYDDHEVLMLHGQRCCYPTNPGCGRCAVLDLCPTGAARLAGRAERSR